MHWKVEARAANSIGIISRELSSEFSGLAEHLLAKSPFACFGIQCRFFQAQSIRLGAEFIGGSCEINEN